jgi:RES domain-containing protein
LNLAALEKILPGARKHLSAYRMVNADFASSIDEIGNSILFGGRYNPKGEFGVLYLALTAQCCLKEKIKQAGGKTHLRPQVLGTFEINIEHGLDLTDEKNLTKLEIDRARLTDPSDFTEPQALAREARRIGFEALIVPSAIGSECTNFVIFKDKLGRKSFCETKDIKSYKL